MFKSKRNTTKTIVTLSLFAVLSMILSRFCAIYITESLRISFGNIPIMLAGIFFGPFAGALVGIVADSVGAMLFSGLGWFPPLTISPMLMGLIPGLLAPMVAKLMKKGTKGGDILAAVIFVVPSNIIVSMGCTTYLLHILYGNPFLALLTARVPLYACISVLEIIVIVALSKAGLFRTLKLGVFSGFGSKKDINSTKSA